MTEKDKHSHGDDCGCDKHEVRDSFEDAKCSEEQIHKCHHGTDFVERLKKEGLID